MKTNFNPSCFQSARPEEFDLIIPCGGTGSTVAAWTLAGEEKRVAVVDRKHVGGLCPNIACLPSKNVIHSAKVASYLSKPRSVEGLISLFSSAASVHSVSESTVVPAA
jgi:pyruvate/2-oxoglutarate dehydrogenase complex dihydrolipoamide dehydrogenase (E3) component